MTFLPALQAASRVIEEHNVLRAKFVPRSLRADLLVSCRSDLPGVSLWMDLYICTPSLALGFWSWLCICKWFLQKLPLRAALFPRSHFWGLKLHASNSAFAQIQAKMSILYDAWLPLNRAAFLFCTTYRFADPTSKACEAWPDRRVGKGLLARWRQMVLCLCGCTQNVAWVMRSCIWRWWAIHNVQPTLTWSRSRDMRA